MKTPYNKLKILTNDVLKDYRKNFLQMNNDIKNLEKFRIQTIKRYKLENDNEIIFSKELFEKCKEQGLLPFAKQARYAFIAKKILISLKNVDTVIPAPWLIDDDFIIDNNIQCLVHGSDNSNKLSSCDVILFERTEGISSTILRSRACEIVRKLEK